MQNIDQLCIKPLQRAIITLAKCWSKTAYLEKTASFLIRRYAPIQAA